MVDFPKQLGLVPILAYSEANTKYSNNTSQFAIPLFWALFCFYEIFFLKLLFLQNLVFNSLIVVI